MKKIITNLGMLTAILMAFLPVSAYDFEVDKQYYNVISLDDMTCEITYADEDYNSYEGDIIIPSQVEYKGKTLSVTGIGSEAFYKCSNLTSIEIPSTITSIGKCAFFYCENLENIDIPSSVIYIGGDAFNGCNKLKSFVIPFGIEILPGGLLANCPNIKEIIIPSNILFVEENAFEKSSIERLIIEDSEHPIEFEGSFVQSLNFIHSSSFGNPKNSKIRYIYLGRNFTILNSKTSADYSPFLGIETIEEVVIGPNVTTLPINTFVSIDLSFFNEDGRYVTLPNLTKFSIKYSQTELKFITNTWTLPYDKYREEDYMYDYFNVQDLCIERNIDFSIHKNPFSIFTNTINAQLIGGITTVNDFFFRGCKYLEKVDLSQNLESIGERSFEDTLSLKSIICRAEVPPLISKSVGFTNDSYLNAEVLVPQASLSSYQQAEVWENFWDIQGFDPASVGEIKYDKTEKARYDINGKVVTKDYNGLVIIRYSDGSTRKLIQHP